MLGIAIGSARGACLRLRAAVVASSQEHSSSMHAGWSVMPAGHPWLATRLRSCPREPSTTSSYTTSMERTPERHERDVIQTHPGQTRDRCRHGKDSAGLYGSDVYIDVRVVSDICIAVMRRSKTSVTCLRASRATCLHILSDISNRSYGHVGRLTRTAKCLGYNTDTNRTQFLSSDIRPGCLRTP